MIRDWRTHCFDMFGDIADYTGRNRNDGPPSWYQPGNPAPAGQAGSADEGNASAAAAVSGVPPRLVVALNQTAVPDYTASNLYQTLKTEKGSDLDFAAPGGVELRFLLKHIYARLSQPFLNADGSAASGSPWPDTGVVDDDEHWARRVAELFSLNAYTTPSTGYAGYITPDKLNDGHVMYKLQDENDPAYSLVMECQHTVTGAAITRGFAIPVLKTDPGKPLSLVTAKMFAAAVSAGAVDGLRLRPLSGDPAVAKAAPTAKSQGLADWLDETHGSTVLANLPATFGPGSAFVFNSSGNGAGQSASDHPHTAFAIRVQRGDDKKVKAIQYLDVGGMNVADSPRPFASINKPDGDGCHAWEYVWSGNAQVGAVGKFRGHSVLRADSTALQYALGKLAKTRPLGLARLVLARRKKAGSNTAVDILNDDPKDWLLYASPLLRMYEDDEARNYAATRYMWSLRDLPGAAEIQALWLLSIPRSHLAEAMVAGTGGDTARQNPSRTTTLTAMVGDVATRKAKDFPSLTKDKPVPVKVLLLGTMDVCVQADGKVAVYDCCKSTTEPGDRAFLYVERDSSAGAGAAALRNLPWGEASTKVAGLDLSTLSDLPGYFSGTP